MPLPLRINNKKYKIPKFTELTVSQYKDVLKHIEKDKDLNVITYLSVVTGLNYKTTIDSEIDIPQFFLDSLGQLVHEFTKIKAPDSIIIDDKEYKKKDYQIRSMGHRFFIEQYMNTNPSTIDAYLFVLAMLFCEEYDYQKIRDFMPKFDNLNYIDVLSMASFFLLNSKIGSKKGITNLKWFRPNILMKTRASKSKQE
jgi:hypothetical protein